jgi:ribosomal protein S27E
LLIIGSLLPDWLTHTLSFLLVLMVLLPVLGVLALRFWFQRNFIQADCPVCGTSLAGFNQMQLQCPSCGELLQIQQGRFERLTSPGTIDATVVEVQAQAVDD